MQIVIDLTEHAAVKNRWSGAPIGPFDEQRTLRARVHVVCALEELSAKHLGHPQIGDDQRHFLALRLHAIEICEGCGRREMRHDLIIAAEPPRERIQQGRERLGFIIDEHDHGPSEHRVLHRTNARRSNSRTSKGPAVEPYRPPSAPSCCIVPSMSTSSHSPAILPPSSRMIEIALTSTRLPVGAIPMNSPR